MSEQQTSEKYNPERQTHISDKRQKRQTSEATNIETIFP